MMLLTNRDFLAFGLTGVFLAITTTGSGQTVRNPPAPNPAGSKPAGPTIRNEGRAPFIDRTAIFSRPFAHPTVPTVVDPQSAPSRQHTTPENQSLQPGSANWNKLIQLVRQNAKWKAEVEKTKAVAEVEIRALQAIADIERRVAEEKRAMLEERNDDLRMRVKELEQEVDRAEQEMRERSLHAEHMERQMMQRTELIEGLERQLQRARREAERPQERDAGRNRRRN